ncbi:Na/Pi cotransporter family protein [Poseidonibacter lekithochrous]|uniref:Na/Pi cotransporter family protein n=1 Tax=Poseidonibacter lekithochrous TaxID=1904463 RepID=UPI0015688E40|nr:Na/Pi symporter [Poseidonibacter lekithochrous]QKJ23354.1 sodium:phosphate symporter [Poseidonibacter lekithochrous]
MLKNLMLPVFLILLAFLLLSNDDAKIIIAGVAIFLIGMVFMEDGFKLFSGGILEKLIEKSTNNIPKAIFTGFISTSVVQSSSLISIIVISFLSGGLIALSSAIGVILGANIGSTTTAWIVASFGVKIKISAFAMPMIIFGVIFRFTKSNSLKGLGNVLLGLGFVFLGISYMKDGFDTLKTALDLSQFAIEGYIGALVYIALGAVATVIIQSSGATMALIITALATNQIIYINALELAIGANIGTTVTAVIAAVASNSNGKRLAVAHFIFNIVTAFIAIVFLYQLSDLVDFLALKVAISEDNYAMKLALFHTIFNVIGVIVVTPFVYKLETFLQGLFKDEKSSKLKAKYLDEVFMKIPDAALISIKKEILHLYENAQEVISHAIYLHRHKFLGSGKKDLSQIVEKSNLDIHTDINQFYTNKIKSLYGEIIRYSALSQENMDEDDKNRVYDLKLASRNIVEAIKDIRDLHRNISIYLKSDNEDIKEEYNNLRVNIANTLRTINEIREEKDDIEVLTSLEVLRENIRNLDDIRNDRLDTLIRENYIDKKMATSLINDTTYAHAISKNLIEAASILFIERSEIQELGDEL